MFKGSENLSLQSDLKKEETKAILSKNSRRRAPFQFGSLCIGEAGGPITQHARQPLFLPLTSKDLTSG